MPEIQRATLPRSPLYRVGRLPDPFAPPDWRYARPDGTFGGRFDDPRGRRGVSLRDGYRVLYFASQPAGAYGETIAQFRPSLKTLTQHAGSAPLTSPPSVPRDWRVARRLGAAVLSVTLHLADLDAAETMQALRPALAPVAVRLHLPDIDLSVASGPQRELTQEAGLHIYSRKDPNGQPLYAGIRYISRLHRGWECWALFEDRVAHHTLRVDPIAADDPNLYEAARILGLAIEDDRGGLFVPA